MNRQNERGPKAFFSVGLLILALVLAGMTAAEMIQIYRGDDQSAIQKKAVAKDLDQDNYEAKIEDAVKTGELTPRTRPGPRPGPRT